MKTITVICGVCETVLLTDIGDHLSQTDADAYQQSTSCNVDGQADIQVSFTEE